MEDSIMQLFGIKDTKTGKHLPDEVFSKKPDAKVRRNALNKECGFDRYRVALGRDHKRYNGRNL
jgi:hypothetical protein|tara:strand:+ start:2015 stop:2206 length:192 start_codon:yes stop_codon:yes gene_type:complete